MICKENYKNLEGAWLEGPSKKNDLSDSAFMGDKVSLSSSSSTIRPSPPVLQWRGSSARAYSEGEVGLQVL